MSLIHLLQKRLDEQGPVRVGLIGAGKFGSMFLSQVPTTPGLEVTVIADLDPQRAQETCADVGWDTARISRTRFLDDGQELTKAADLDVVVEATRHPAAGVVHARTAIREGKHIVMVNVEADVLVGPVLAREAEAAGVVYSMAYGDQPALTCELVDWARACGFEVVAAGKGTRYLPSYHTSTPDTVWDHYGLTAEQAGTARMNPRMFNSFLDGTKSAIEMAAIANATELTPAPDGLVFPPCGIDDLPNLLRPREVGGQLNHKGQVEVVSSLERDGRPVDRDLRWGVYVVLEAPNDYAANCFHMASSPIPQVATPRCTGLFIWLGWSSICLSCLRRFAVNRPDARRISGGMLLQLQSGTWRSVRCWMAREATPCGASLCQPRTVWRLAGCPLVSLMVPGLCTTC